MSYFPYIFIYQWTLGLVLHFSYLKIAAMHMGIQIPLLDPAFNSFECILRSPMAGSDGNSIFNFLRNCPSVFHSDSTIFYEIGCIQGGMAIDWLSHSTVLAPVHEGFSFSISLPAFVIFFKLKSFIHMKFKNLYSLFIVKLKCLYNQAF